MLVLVAPAGTGVGIGVGVATTGGGVAGWEVGALDDTGAGVVALVPEMAGKAPPDDAPPPPPQATRSVRESNSKRREGLKHFITLLVVGLNVDKL